MNRYYIKGTFSYYRLCTASSVACTGCTAGNECMGHEAFTTIEVTIDASSHDEAAQKVIAPYEDSEEASWLFGQPEITLLHRGAPVTMVNYWTAANGEEKRNLRNGLM